MGESKSLIGKKNMRRIKKLIIISILLGLMNGCNTKDLIVGEWERYDDLNKGTIIRVEKIGECYNAFLVKINESMYSYGFRTGEIYWKDVVKIEKNKYKALCLFKGYENSRQIFGYSEQYIILISNDSLVTKNFISDERLISGGEHKWERNNSNKDIRGE